MFTFRSLLSAVLILSNLLSVCSLVTSAEAQSASQEQISAKQLAAPKRITLPKEPITLTNALNSFTEQSGYRMELDESTKGYEQFFKVQTRTLEIRNLPLWSAVDRVCEAFELTTKDVDRETIVLGIDDSYELRNPLMAGPQTAGPFSVCLRMSDDHPRVFLRTEPAFVWPHITSFRVTMVLANKRVLRQNWPVPAICGLWKNGATSFAFQPDGVENMEALRNSGVQIAQFFVELELEVPVKWETRSLPKLSDWQVQPFQIGKTEFLVTDYGVRTKAATAGGVTRPLYEPYIHVRTTSPWFGRDPGSPIPDDVRLKFDDGSVIKTSKIAKIYAAEEIDNIETSPRFFLIDFDAPRANQPAVLKGNATLELFFAGKGFRKSPPLSEILPAKFAAGKALLTIENQFSSDGYFGIESEPFIIKDVLIGFQNGKTKIGVQPGEMLAQEGSEQVFELKDQRPIENPETWHPLVNVPTETRKVVLQVNFDDVSWPSDEPEN